MDTGTGYRVSSTFQRGILEIVITGCVTKGMVEDLQDEVFAVISEHRANGVIVDIRGLEGRFGPADAYFRVRGYPPDLQIRSTAVVDIAEHKDFQTFFETTAHNAGLSLKWFTDMEAAREWIKGMLQGNSAKGRESGVDGKGA